MGALINSGNPWYLKVVRISLSLKGAAELLKWHRVSVGILLGKKSGFTGNSDVANFT